MTILVRKCGIGIWMLWRKLVHFEMDPELGTHCQMWMMRDCCIMHATSI
jgi:hypothetical protein